MTPIPTIRIPHPYYVKTILPLEQVLPGRNTQYILTGSTDEQIRVWDLSFFESSFGSNTILDKSRISTAVAAKASEVPVTDKRVEGCLFEVEGHFHEVTRLGFWVSRSEAAQVDEHAGISRARKQSTDIYIVSAGLDCTVRKWKLQDILEPAKAGKNGQTEHDGTKERIIPKHIKNLKEQISNTAAMTAEEEAELMDLMGDD